MALEHHDKQRAAQLRLLTQTGPGTLMGKVLRQFWHPVATSASVTPGTARSLRIMCEDLTLYRGESGAAHVIGGNCAHRCTALHTGWVQGEQVRCMYHGWRYDGSGQCTEMPAEKNAKPELARIAGYPTHEYSGLIFAFLGAGAAPPFELPRKDALEKPAVDVSNHVEAWDCNWLQQSENSLDGSHLAFVHQWPAATQLGSQIGAAIPELQYEETSAGIRQTAIRPNGIRISNWTFPNNNHVLAAPAHEGDPWIDAVAWQVPIDDENTLRISCLGYPGGEVGKALRAGGSLMTGTAMDHVAVIFDEHRLPDISEADRIMAQDYAAVRGQGVIHDRSNERLGASDAGIALLRRIMFREMDAVRTGTPPKQWARTETLVEMQRLVPAR